LLQAIEEEAYERPFRVESSIRASYGNTPEYLGPGCRVWPCRDYVSRHSRTRSSAALRSRTLALCLATGFGTMTAGRGCSRGPGRGRARRLSCPPPPPPHGPRPSKVTANSQTRHQLPLCRPSSTPQSTANLEAANRQLTAKALRAKPSIISIGGSGR